MQSQLEIASAITEKQVPTESETDFQAEEHPDSVGSALTERQSSELEEEKQRVGELTAKVTSLQKLLEIASAKTVQKIPSESDVDFQIKQKSESVITVLKDQQRRRLDEEQKKVTELTSKVASLQEQLNSEATQLSILPSSPAAELMPVDANSKIKRIIEALLFAAEQAMTVKQLHAVFPELEAPKKQKIQDALDSLRYDYQRQGIELHKVASGYRFQVKADMASWVARLFAEKPPKYSRALLETIAIIAYQQPVTRGDIEEIRGVSVSSNMIRTLLEREWVTVLSHKEVPGRPALYGTTRQFLDYFNLDSLEGMPSLDELQALTLEGELEV